VSTPEPHVVVCGGGDLVLAGLPEALLEVLRDIPSILEEGRRRKESRSRLFPDAYDDEDSNRSWRKHARPEIEALFASAAELVARDLQAAAPEAKRSWKVAIPSSSHAAWMSALNAARLVLGAVHRVTPEDMERLRSAAPQSERDAAILKIHLLGWIEELLVAAA
jgi:uncharacterized protein DUF2017